MINFEELTLEEIETMEALTGSSIDTLFENGKPRGKALKAFVWVAMKRTNPTFSIEEASKYTMKQAVALFNGDEEKKE